MLFTVPEGEKKMPQKPYLLMAKDFLKLIEKRYQIPGLWFGYEVSLFKRSHDKGNAGTSRGELIRLWEP